jgi:hypothetical protein
VSERGDLGSQVSEAYRLLEAERAAAAEALEGRAGAEANVQRLTRKMAVRGFGLF